MNASSPDRRPADIRKPFLRSVFLPAAVLAALAAFGCSLTDSSSSDPVALNTKARYMGAYRLQGDSLVLQRPADSDFYCGGDSIVVDTYSVSPDTSLVRLQGNRLSLLHNAGRTSRDVPGPVTTSMNFNRVGSGTSLEGIWRLEGETYTLAAGKETDSLKALWDEHLKLLNHELDFGRYEMELSGGRETVRISVQWAPYFQALWMGEFESKKDSEFVDNNQYDVAVRLLADDQVELKGRLTGEVVRISFSEDGTRSYSSSDTTHHAYRDTDKPEACPMNDWYESEFLNANEKESTVNFKRSSETRGRLRHASPFF